MPRPKFIAGNWKMYTTRTAALELAAAVELKRMFEHARHFPRRGWHARDGHERTFVDLEHLVGAIINDEIPRRSAPVAGDEDTVGVFEGEDRGAVCRHGRRGGVGDARRPGGRGWIKASCPQQRREVLGRGSNRLRRAQRAVHHWPVRWR